MADRAPATEGAALSALFRAQSARINGLLITRCGDRALAEELTAQTFEAAASRFAQDRGHEVTGAWLTTVALRRLVDHWRASGRWTRARVTLMATERTAPPPGDPFDSGVLAALDSLGTNQRAALTLRYLDDWSVAEVAEALGLSYQATESLLARGRRSLRAALEAEGAWR